MQTPTTEMPSIEQLYEEQIRSLTPEQKLRLIALIASELAEGLPKRPKRSIMELHGLGAGRASTRRSMSTSSARSGTTVHDAVA
jgi:hypothetical protein